MSNSFRSRVSSGERLIGTIVSLDSPAVAEVCALAGFDWLFLDAEHGALGPAQLQGLLQGVGNRVPCVVRVVEPAEAPIKQALDVGASGVIAPSVNSAAQAEDVVRFARYSPIGLRGVGLARAHGYGRTFAEYLEKANDELAVIVQAEHIDAVNQIDQIVKVPGIDAVLIGPYDLSASLGKMGQVDDPEVVEAIDQVTKACQAAGIALGIFGVTPAALAPYIERGYSFLIVGTDAMLLSNGADQALQQMNMLSA